MLQDYCAQQNEQPPHSFDNGIRLLCVHIYIVRTYAYTYAPCKRVGFHLFTPRPRRNNKTIKFGRTKSETALPGQVTRPHEGTQHYNDNSFLILFRCQIPIRIFFSYSSAHDRLNGIRRCRVKGTHAAGSFVPNRNLVRTHSR